MKNHQLRIPILIVVALLIVPIGRICDVASASDELTAARNAIERCMKQLGVSKSDTDFLVLTNAYYTQDNGKGMERYRDLLSEVTGCTSGKQSLLDVHTVFDNPLWFSFWSKRTSKTIFCRKQGSSFQSVEIDAAPEKILDVKAWNIASEGLVGPKTLSQVISIGLGWRAGTDWTLMKIAGFHDQLLPGVNFGYLFHLNVEKQLPRQKGDELLFFGAIPKCYMDTIQMLYDTTLGKERAYGIAINKKQLKQYMNKSAMPCVTALKVNKEKNECKGIVLGFSPKQIMGELGVSMADLNAPGGESNPLYYISRIKASLKLAKMKPEDQLKWIKEFRSFSGDAKLAHRICNAGGDPYAIIWKK